MALIGKIRQNGWILITALGVSLFGFIVNEFVQNKNQYSQGDANTIGRVNGTEIKRSTFDAYQAMVYGNSKSDPFQVRSQVFSYFVEEALVKETAENVGLGVSKEELLDLEFGTAPSPIIQQRFANESGMVNMQQLQQIKAAIDAKNLPADYRQYWAVQEEEIIKERLQSKYASMVAKAVYTPKWQAEMGFMENNHRFNFNYVRIPYDKVDPGEVKPTDADYASYLEANKEQFYQADETRTLEFAVLDVVPTTADTATAMKLINTALAGWATASNDSAYVTATDGGNWSAAFKTKAELPPSIADTLAKTGTGSIIGPIMADGTYMIAKVLARKAVPDSVRARHILIKPDQIGLEGAEKLVDSLLYVLASKKTSFDSLAARFGTDGTATKGGDLNWFGPGSMVKEFNDAAFYTLEQGKPAKVLTNFGWHVIEVTGKKFTTNQSGMQLALITERIAPSKGTQSNFRQKAEAMARDCKTYDQLLAAATKAGIQLSPAPAARENDFQVGAMANGQDARDILRWAFGPDSKSGAVSKVVFTQQDMNGGYFDAKYLVAAVKSIRPKGYAKVADVKEQIETQVANRKRADILMAKIKDTGNMEALASQFGVQVDQAANVNFLSPSLAAAGFEPKVVGRALGLADGQISKAIPGNSGVYVVSKGVMANPIETPADLTMFKRQLSSGISGQVRQRLFSVMKKTAEVEDMRSRFF
jgi:peptidyl-prolyl cis-trans isomerase D